MEQTIKENTIRDTRRILAGA